MEILLLVIGLVVGAGASYWYCQRTLKAKYEIEHGDYERCAAKLSKVYEMLSACHKSVWGPVGLAQGIKDEYFNRVWEWAGLQQKGCPK